MRPSALLLAAVVLLALAAPTLAQSDPALLGRWVATGEQNRGEILVVEAGFVTIAEDRMPYRVVTPGLLLVGDDEDGDRVRYQVTGDDLVLEMDGARLPYRREGTARKPPAPRPAEPERDTKPEQRPGNPLARAHADPFARAFAGEDVKLTLRKEGAEYRGELEFQGASYPVEARAEGSRLSGRFVAAGTGYDFTALLAGDLLTLESGGATYTLTAAPVAAAPRNPLARGPGAETPRPVAADAGAAPPPLDGVFDGAAQPWEHPRGWLSFELPEGWSVHSQDDAGMLVNPGLQATDTLEAIVGLLWGRLPRDDQSQPVGKVIEKHVPELRQALAQQGLDVGEPRAPVATFAGKEVPGAVLTFRGRTQQGQAVEVWFGGVVKADAWVAVAGVLLEGREARYLPKVKRIFRTLAPRPPQRNAAAEAALVGRELTASQQGKVIESGYHTTYAFAAGGVVTRRSMGFVPARGGLPGAEVDATASGRYEVCGDVLYLYFESGQEVGQVIAAGGRVTGIRIGAAVYQ